LCRSAHLDTFDLRQVALRRGGVPISVADRTGPKEHAVTDASLFTQVLDPAHRPDPYPLYARLHETPILRDENGLYVVSTMAEIRSLLKDPRVSSEDLPKPRFDPTWNPIKALILDPLRGWIIEKHRPLVFRDPPDHDVLRGAIMHHFSPERMKRLQGRIDALVEHLVDAMRGRKRIDIVADFAYPLPVGIICELLGVPPEDEPKFHPWSRVLTQGLEPFLRADPDYLRANIAAYEEMGAYLGALMREKRRHPKDDILSSLATFKDKKSRRLSKYDAIATAILLLVAGHETTVTLIANGMLTLMRHPEHLARLREDRRRAAAIVEEVLRFDPPGHFRTRKALADIEIAGTTIPKGAPIVLVFAAANRDPLQFRDPDRFDPDRLDNQHLGFGAGIHYCLGAQLARMEAGAALAVLARRLVSPRLVADPPPYTLGASLRGPERLELEIEGITG
jgi:cytochrome P450